jgi:hypothetical protein
MRYTRKPATPAVAKRAKKRSAKIAVRSLVYQRVG